MCLGGRRFRGDAFATRDRLYPFRRRMQGQPLGLVNAAASGGIFPPVSSRCQATRVLRPRGFMYHAEVLWALDQPVGRLDRRAVLRDSLTALDQLSSACVQFRKQLPARTHPTLEQLESDIRKALNPKEVLPHGARQRSRKRLGTPVRRLHKQSRFLGVTLSWPFDVCTKSAYNWPWGSSGTRRAKPASTFAGTVFAYPKRFQSLTTLRHHDGGRRVAPERAAICHSWTRGGGPSPGGRLHLQRGKHPDHFRASRRTARIRTI